MNISIRWPIILGAIILVWGTHLIIAPYSYMMSERVLTQHATDIMQNISDLTLEQSYNHLNKAQSAAHLAKQLLSSSVFENNESGDESLERYFFDQLIIYPHLAGIYFATQNGDFFYVSRNETHVKGGFRTKIIRNTEAKRSCVMLWRDNNFTLLKKESTPDDTYDPRQRPWFKKVIRHRGIVWTAPYIFFTSKQPGVTIAGPAFSDVGKLKGIVGVDIDIAELSSFIGRMRVGKSGRAFIMNRNRDVIAFPDAKKLTIQEENASGFRLAKVEELGDPIAKAAFESIDWQLTDDGDFIIDKPTSSNFEMDGNDYICMFTPFPEERLSWVIGVYVPAEDYLGDLKENRLVNSISTALVSILASLLGLLFAKRIIAAVKNLQREAKAMEENDLKSSFNMSSSFSELQEAGNSLMRMKKSLIEYKERLLKNEQVYRIITNTANDAIVMLDEFQTIIYWNPAAEVIFGWREEEMVGQKIQDAILPNRFSESFTKNIIKFTVKGIGPFSEGAQEVQMADKLGRQCTMEMSLARLEIGNKWHVAAIIRDISERKRNEQLKRRLVRDLHDGIGGNLANIKLLSEMAKHGEASKASKMALNSISEVSDNCIAEIRNYMNVLDEESLNWQNTLEELRQYCLKTLEPHSVELKVVHDIIEDAPRPSTLMYMNLFKIIREAVTNVIKHANASELLLEIKVDQKTLTCDLSDNGKSTRSKSGSGRGLLSMESRAVEMGGSLHLTYNDGMHIHLQAPIHYVELS